MLQQGRREVDTDASGLIVLGGGLAGLGAAMKTQAPCYEAADRPGGVSLSDTTDGFTFDRGIHILQTQNEEILALFSELGIEMEMRDRNAHIHSHGTYTAYPFQVNTAGLPIGLRARCVWNFLRRAENPPPENYEEWIYRAMGRGFGDTFLIPYSEKFWTVHPREMTHDWMGDRVPQASIAQVLRGALWSKQTAIGTNVQFRYPMTGYGDIPNALATRCGDIHVAHRATRIEPAAHRVHFDNGSVVDYRAMISSIPLPELVRIADDAPSEVKQAAARLRTNSILVVNLGIDQPAISDRHWVHFPEKDVAFFRISYPHNLSRKVAPSGMSSISAEVAYSWEEGIDREGIVDRVREDLIRTGALPAEAPVVTSATHDIRYGYCVFDFHRSESLRVIHAWLDRHDIVPTGRYGLWEYFWSDQAIVSGFESAARAVERLAV